MPLTKITCFKKSGKYYSEKVTNLREVPTWELRQLVFNNPDCWPVISLSEFYTVVEPEDGVPIMIMPEA